MRARNNRGPIVGCQPFSDRKRELGGQLKEIRDDIASPCGRDEDEAFVLFRKQLRICELLPWN
jgi:hypothetical protein